ncbi:hypothetical protein [Streptomyces sp. Ag109_G2-15]|nr:hypothetical protein [Streptomyces sp. Ag109_G2-15]
MIAGVCVAGAGSLVVATILPRGRVQATAPAEAEQHAETPLVADQA